MTNSNPDTQVRAKPIFERHLQTLLLTLVAGLIAWQGITTLKLIETTARQDERISQLITMTEQLRNDLRDADSQYMTNHDARIYRDQLNSRIDDLDNRVSRLEGR
ncbi:hypothetical protein RSO41_05980 [Halomonas sp. I1]|uniref:hypothetical protein n=1 Tax=Halomonas sp. I1 TaxID=393536 RepID=UPI0028DEDC3A|nr:hypothetical protein [Halomonas sp. I1]MDT8894198.1 hypothetical protein [Halomonas sp. I1]